MTKSEIPTITIEAAVARMINLDFFEDEDSQHLCDLLEIMCESLEKDYNKAKGNIPDEQLKTIELLWIASKARLKFAISLQKALQHSCISPVEIKTAFFDQTGNISIRCGIDVVDQAGGRPLIDVNSVSNLAKTYFRTNITNWKPRQTSLSKITRWEDCEIRIYKNFKIALFDKGSYHLPSSFQDIGLWRKKDNSPNKSGEILFWMSLKKETSDYSSAESHGTKHGVIPKDITLLRKALKKLTGLSSDPFFPVNDEGNYKPRFKVINDMRNADERAKLWASHVEYDDRLSHDDVIDYEDEFLKTLSFNKKAEEDYR